MTDELDIADLCDAAGRLWNRARAAESRADAAEAAIARVRELHQPRPDDYPGAVRYCSDCLRADEGNPDIEWPCATIRALDGEVSE